jgi:hypothetical protein
VVLVFHGCPDTRRVAMTGDAAAREVGVRLLAFNRPGYGSSTPTDSTHTSVARDAAELLDLWGIERVACRDVGRRTVRRRVRRDVPPPHDLPGPGLGAVDARRRLRGHGRGVDGNEWLPSS